MKRHFCLRLLRAALALALANACLPPWGEAATQAPEDASGWRWEGIKASVSFLHTATPLRDDSVLVAGGVLSNGLTTSSSWLFDQSSKRLTKGPSMTVPRKTHKAVALENGDVLVAGGYSPPDPIQRRYPNDAAAQDRARRAPSTPQLQKEFLDYFDSLRSPYRPIHVAEIYRAKSKKWVAVPDPHLDERRQAVLAGLGTTGQGPAPSGLIPSSVQSFYSLVRLESSRCQKSPKPSWCGQVLLITGNFGSSIALIYDPMRSAWRTVEDPDFTIPDGAVSLHDGSVFAFGQGLKGEEVLDPATGKWRQTDPPPIAGDYGMPLASGVSALKDGRVLVTGGDRQSVQTDAVQIFDPRSQGPGAATFGSWKLAAKLPDAREYHQAALLSDGRVLVVGGNGQAHQAGHFQPEPVIVYDAARNEWRQVAPVPASQANKITTAGPYGLSNNATITPLSDGSVLVLGDIFGLGPQSLAKGAFGASGALYSPPRLIPDEGGPGAAKAARLNRVVLPVAAVLLLAVALLFVFKKARRTARG